VCKQMSDEWWPTLLSHIPNENPWADSDVIVAEIRSFDERPHAGQRRTFSALVPINQLEDVKNNLAGLDHDVSTSGPHPFPDGNYFPEFSIRFEGPPRQLFEPLVLSWRSHDKGVLQPDPGFLMTYGLTPRIVENSVFWDDPAAPTYDVVKVSAPSMWKFPLGTTALVSIQRDYLQDYLTLTNAALVQVFWEHRFGRTDNGIEKRLGDKESVSIDFTDRKFLLNRHVQDRAIVSAQVWGGRVIALPHGLPITENSLEKEGLLWPGYKTPVTDGTAMAMNVNDYVYVDDTVLAQYEGRPEFSINPNTGSVSFGTQWSVAFCDRVGRSLIRLELKKLYEGVPPQVTRHWNRYAIEPPTGAALDAAFCERNIGIRAEEITFAVVALGESLVELARSIGFQAVSEDFVSLRRQALEYQGWWKFDETDAVSRHVPLQLNADLFLDRCMSLNKLVVEGLSEAWLRRILETLGVPSTAIEKFGTLKLLNCIVRMAQVSRTTGLRLAEQGAEIWRRLEKEGTTPAQPMALLFALYDLRIAKAHKGTDLNKKLAEELERFDVGPNVGAGGYGRILDKVYDGILDQLTTIRAKIMKAL